MNLPLLPLDKANHVIYGAIASLCMILAFTFVNIPYAAFAGVIAGIGVGILKEALDYFSNRASGFNKLQHSVDKLDIVYTIVGATIPALAKIV